VDSSEDAVAYVRNSIRNYILNGEYGPRSRLVEADICEEFGVSRFIARIALRELASERLVVVQRNKGARVRALSIEEAIEITEVRIELEGLIARFAAERVQEDQALQLANTGTLMEKAVADGDVLRYGDLNLRLHSLLQEIAGHATASRILDELYAQFATQQLRVALQPGRSSASLPEHQAIIAAVIGGNSEAAAEAMTRHLQSVIEALKQMPADATHWPPRGESGTQPDGVEF